MAIPSADYRNAMARLGAAVNIVTTDGPAGLHGLTVSSVCSINRANRGYGAVRENGVLCVNILGPCHEDLSARFARSAADVDERFGDREAWMTMPSGSPGLRDATVSLDCVVARLLDVGTHGMFICEATDVRFGPSCGGLVYFDRGFYGVTRS